MNSQEERLVKGTCVPIEPKRMYVCIYVYIEGRNCRLSTVTGLFNKAWAFAFGPRTPLSSWWLGWRHHARVGKPVFGKSFRFIISKLHYCYVSYNFVPDKRNTAWLRDTVRQTFRGKSAAGEDLRSARRPLTSLGTSVWPYRVTTQYSYNIDNN